MPKKQRKWERGFRTKIKRSVQPFPLYKKKKEEDKIDAVKFGKLN